MKVDALIDQCTKGNHRAAAKLITLIENKEYLEEIIPKLYPYRKNSYIIGITGAPGVGKSTITDKLITQFRHYNATVGVVAIDPTSPFSGGALLGDRIRLQKHATDERVFIRSMGSRGHLGGLAPATNDVLTVLAALGCDYIIIETVGVGQSEIEIVKYADMVLLVLTPGSGDSMQVMKAGIMEIGDIFVINKCDRPGVDKIESELNLIQQINQHKDRLRPIAKIVAPKEIGMDILYKMIMELKNEQEKSSEIIMKHRVRIKNEILSNLQDSIYSHIQTNLIPEKKMETCVDIVFDNKSDPITMSRKLLDEYQKNLS
ncbi:MAG TPA: methylmalonyl Co-A mutase-associated GTPase MeaB [Candidatus Cloacimonetes bacterium]|nr:methylmalonyl Co-A mutase-associated GTPase MeaB [Candidatus Cloacimonadota bacterium]HEX37616.1 methylmalonyl Co-A mutase-associated GTPase MeaB [Candidatus Cloacimonadota bacterium]